MNNNATKFWGIVLFVVGIVFFLSNYAVIPETVSRIWPIVLLGFGLKLLFTKKEQASRA